MNLMVHWDKNLFLVVLVVIFFISTAIIAPWFNLSVSNHLFVKSYWVFSGVGLLMFWSIWTKSNVSSIKFKINFVKLSLSILFILGLLSLLWSSNIDFAINKLLLWVITFFSFILALNISSRFESILILCYGLFLMSLVIATIGVLQVLFDPFTLTQASPPASTFGNKNIATQVIVLTFPISLLIYLSERTQGIKLWLFTIGLSITMAYVFFSTSRAAYISISTQLVLITIYFVFNKNEIKKPLSFNKSKLYAILYLFLLTIFLIHLIPSSDSNVIEISNKNAPGVISTVGYRFDIWKTALNMFFDHPILGSGIGSFASNIANEGYASWNINNTFKAHNDIIELIVELGSLGLILFIIIVTSLCFALFFIIRRSVLEAQIFYYLVFVSLVGSFINLQFSFPYQMPVPLLLFGLYCGLIAKQLDKVNRPIMISSFSLDPSIKKIILGLFFGLFIVVLTQTYYPWFKTYNHLNKVNNLENFNNLEFIETPIYYSNMQQTLYSLGGVYFRKGKFKQSFPIDKQFLKVWPNHLDVLFRFGFANHKLNKNNEALEIADRLKKLEPPGLYNANIIEMHVFQSSKEISKLEEIFYTLMNKPEGYLLLNPDTIRFLIYFALESKKMGEKIPILYDKYVKSFGLSCEVENNVAIYYFNLEEFEKSASHVKNVLNNNDECMNPKLINYLDEMKLLES